jgi:hypothetical protein
VVIWRLLESTDFFSDELRFLRAQISFEEDLNPADPWLLWAKWRPARSCPGMFLNSSSITVFISDVDDNKSQRIKWLRNPAKRVYHHGGVDMEVSG